MAMPVRALRRSFSAKIATAAAIRHVVQVPGRANRPRPGRAGAPMPSTHRSCVNHDTSISSPSTSALLRADLKVGSQAARVCTRTASSAGWPFDRWAPNVRHRHGRSRHPSSDPLQPVPGLLDHDRLRRSTGTFFEIPFSAVLENRVEPSEFRNEIVVIGATAPSLQDVHSTSSFGPMSGPEIQANSIETILRGFPLRTRTGVDVALIALLGVLAPLVSIWLGSLAVILTAVAVGTLYAVTAQIAFDRNVLLAVTYPLLTLLLATLGVLAWRLRRHPVV